MELTFIGADHEVTGSCHLLTACGKHILIDCGLEQGNDTYENVELPVPASDIDFVLFTHAHIDHTGMLPNLYAKGFRGRVCATKATCGLCDIMLRDSAHIQMFEAEWRNRKAKRSGGELYIPLYDMNDVEGVLRHFEALDYGERAELSDGIHIRFTDVGHLLGSASIEIWLAEEGVERCIVFSGDIGNQNQPLIRDPQYTEKADYVVMESTYGNRSHGEHPDYVGELAAIFEETFARGGNVVIPAFAVGRTQELLYFIRKIKEEGRLSRYAGFEVYVDSPLAIEATNIFKENITDCFDSEALELVRRGINPLSFPGLKTSVTSEQSKLINFNPNPKVIISASGMCEAGRIRHHLKHNLWRPECTVIFVGYQAHGTLGRALLEGVQEVTLFGEKIGVCAQIRRLEGISGHADREGLLRWVEAYQPVPRMAFVVHGEDLVCQEFAELLESRGIRAEAPYSGSAFDLARGIWQAERDPVRIPQKAARAGDRRAKSVYNRLLAAGQRLLTVIGHNKGGANKDLAKFTDQINSLCDKWDR